MMIRESGLLFAPACILFQSRVMNHNTAKDLSPKNAVIQYAGRKKQTNVRLQRCLNQNLVTVFSLCNWGPSASLSVSDHTRGDIRHRHCTRCVFDVIMVCVTPVLCCLPVSCCDEAAVIYTPLRLGVASSMQRTANELNHGPLNQD